MIFRKSKTIFKHFPKIFYFESFHRKFLREKQKISFPLLLKRRVGKGSGGIASKSRRCRRLKAQGAFSVFLFGGNGRILRGEGVGFGLVFVVENAEESGEQGDRADECGIVAQVFGGETAEGGADDKGENDQGVDAALAEFCLIFFVNGAVQVEDSLAHVVGAESRCEFGTAAVGESVVLQGAEECDGSVSKPVGGGGRYKRDGGECDDFEACDGDVGVFSFQYGREDGGNEDPEEVSEYGKEVAGSAGKFAGAKVQGKEYEVACLGVAEDAAVEHIGESFEESSGDGEGQKDEEGIFGGIRLEVFLHGEISFDRIKDIVFYRRGKVKFAVQIFFYGIIKKTNGREGRRGKRALPGSM